MRPLFLTNTPILGGTARILQYWLQLGKQNDLTGRIVTRADSRFAEWGKSHEIDTLIDPMPWPERLKPWHGAWHAFRVANWGRRVGVDVIHSNEHNVYPFASLLKRFLRRPTVCHVRYTLERGFATWAFRGTRAPDVLLWTSHQQKLDCSDAVAGIISEERQHVLRLGIDLSTFGLNPSGGSEFRRRLGIADDQALIGAAMPLRP